MHGDVSVYRNSSDTVGVSVRLESVIERIRDGKRGLDAKTEMCNLLAATDPAAYKSYKETKLPAVTFAGIFPRRKRQAAHLEKHSGLVVLDIDGLTAEQLPDVLVAFAQDPRVRLAFISPSGAGVKVIVRVDPIPKNDAEHQTAWRACVDDFEILSEEHGFEIDPSGKDVSRLCYLAQDTQAIVNPNPSPITWDPKDVYLHTSDLEDYQHSATDTTSLKAFLLTQNVKILGPRPRGGFYIECLNRAEHTGGLQGKNDTFVRLSEYGLIYHCSHSHCEDKKSRWFFEQIGIKKDPFRTKTVQKPIRLKKRADFSFVAEALEKSREFLSNALENGKGILGLRADTGVGKNHKVIELYQIQGIRGFFSTPTTELAKETYARMVAAEIDVLRWRGIQSEPDGEFPHEKPCIQPQRYVAYLESGRNAYEILCSAQCPEIDRCLTDGYRSQEQKARAAQVTVAAHKDLLFNPAFRPTAKRLLPQHAEDMIVIDEFDVFQSYLEIDVSQARLEYLTKTWYDHNLGTFAKLILRACLEEENPFKSIRTLVKQLTDTERNQIFSALTQYRTGDTILSRQEAHALETRSRPKTLSEIKSLPLIETDDWNLLIQLELFFEIYTDPENAPIRWKDNSLTFAIQPLPLFTKATVVCMSATLVKDFFLKTFAGRQAKRGDVSFKDGEDTEWHPEARVFQLRTNRNPRATLLIAELDEKENWIYTGLTATGQAYMEKILESLKMTDGPKGFISHKIIVEKYKEKFDEMGVKTGHFGGLVGLDAHFGRDTDDGITLHILGSPEIPKNEVEYRAKLLGVDTDIVREGCVKAELTQAVGRAGLVKNPSTVFLHTSVELPSVSHRDQTTLFDDTDWTPDIEELTERIQHREQNEASAEEAQANGDVEGLAKATGHSDRTAYRKTEQPRQQTKAEMKQQAFDLYDRDGLDFTEIARRLSENQPKMIHRTTVSRWFKARKF